MSESYLTAAQVRQLLAPVNEGRVKILKGNDYLAQHDVRAHMNRVFGFGRWSTKVLATAFQFEEQDANKRWKAGYSATVQVSVYAPDGTFLASYEDSHFSGNAPQPDRADAHALALTTAVSTAFKRACTYLGDQFGLGLYEKDREPGVPFVRGSLVLPEIPAGATPTLPDVKVTGDGIDPLPDAEVSPGNDTEQGDDTSAEAVAVAEQILGGKVLS